MEELYDGETPWFEKGSQVGSKTPDVVTTEHERFKKRLSRTLKGPLSSLASNREELVQHIRKAGEKESIELGDLAVNEFRASSDTLQTYKDKRKGGFRAANTALQDGLFAVSRFAAAYSSILDAVSSASGPYAQVGYQTMTVLLIVVVNKKNHDSKIQGHLDQIQKILPRLERWKGIYRDAQMQELVSKTYHLVIQFSRAAADYFTHFWKRAWLAIYPMAMGGFDNVAQSIYRTLAEVNAEANQGLHARSHNIEKIVLELRTEAEKADEDRLILKTQNDELRLALDTQKREDEKRDRQADEERFQILEEILSPDVATASHPCFSVDLAKQSLQAAFPNVQQASPRVPWSLYTQMTPSRILTDPAFRTWSSSETSSLLFIQGRTKGEGRASTTLLPCWLSPAAIHIVEHLLCQEDNGPMKDKIIYFSCRPNTDHVIERATDVLSMVSLRLMSTRKDMLRDRLQDFQKILFPGSPVSPRTPPPSWSRPMIVSEMRSQSTPALSFLEGDQENHRGGENIVSRMPAPSLRQLRRFLAEVLSEIHKRQTQEAEGKERSRATAYIVLDRIERVHDGKFQSIMNELARLVAEDVGFQVKIAVVVERRLAEGSWHKDMLLDPDRVCEFSMDQRELDRSEDSGKKLPSIWADWH